VALILSVFRALILAAATVILAMADIGLPNDTFWDGKEKYVYWALAGTVIISILEAIQSRFSSGWGADRAYTYQDDIQATLASTLVEVTKITGASWMDTGVHAFWITRKWFRRRLVNIGGIRLGAQRMHRPRWTIGKGVIGQAWKSKSVVREDWRTFYSINYAAGKKKWERKQKDDRYRLDWDELKDTEDYERIIAHPIVDSRRRRVVGCISIDGPFTNGQINGPVMESYARHLARKIRGLGPPPSRWLQQRV
jgi:hypothetical protein